MDVRVDSGDDVVLRTADAGRVIADVFGVLDQASAGRIAELAVALLTPDARVLVLDLSGVTFCDSSGLSAMLSVRRRARELGAGLAFVAVPSQLSRRIQLAGLCGVLGSYATTGDALAAQDPSV
ncbi:STAS domain-containing protein [Saccharothrix algeriensis]|uniref:Anti-anti-sigma factor n=1 Tax=Saccharothrix algeriensis TaxID=173560 RepID=A0A8T8I120_9PSEU|nr:STAS domain-containing protein [Saccharothrix algeriensis]MBM7809322.1 anti-anti-sigma factor [Saccharothrix algeriensis]QTR03664.1 STAS domain-containing protein [Saccharothrix algeriensis]